MKITEKGKLTSLFKWAINKYFDENEDKLLSCSELQELIGIAWAEMIEDGEIVLFDD